MSNQRQSASSGSQELPAHSLPLLGLLLLCPALHPCPTAPLAGLAGGDGNQPQHHSAGCAVCLALLPRMCLWQQRRHQQTLGSASPAEGPSLLCRGLRYFTGVQIKINSRTTFLLQRQLLCNLATPAILYCFYFEYFC